MWTATLQSIRKRDDAKVEFLVLFTDGVRKAMREYTVEVLDDAEIKKQARNEIVRLTAKESAAVPLTIKVGDPIDISSPAPPPPTAEQTARKSWFDRYFKLQQQTRLVQLGLLGAVSVDVVKLKADFLPAYLDQI